MNYFAHGMRYLDRPEFLAGTAVPDWLSVADRRVRVRPQGVEPIIQDGLEQDAEIAGGILQHLHDDGWFHATRGFFEVTAEMTRRFRALLGSQDDYRPGFLGHIVTEMLLDAVLIARHPAQLDLYYATLEGVDPHCVQSVVNRAARRATDRLAMLIPRFLQERFLYDYRASNTLLARLNQVLRRVTLQPLPDSAIAVLDFGREFVAAHVDDLLPARHFADSPQHPAADDRAAGRNEGRHR